MSAICRSQTPGPVAIIDDEQGVRSGLGSLMRSIGVDARLFDGAVSFLEEDIGNFALVLSDIQMPEISGLELLLRIRSRAPELPVILMTAFPDPRIRERAEAGGAYRFLIKPIDADAVVEIVESVLSGTASH